ncbi:unnamed protein product [Peniophora sp. CBMAI 1063]|nr:unnamed protein product [Peniophora sp. CBMAI 1063]
MEVRDKRRAPLAVQRGAATDSKLLKEDRNVLKCLMFTIVAEEVIAHKGELAFSHVKRSRRVDRDVAPGPDQPPTEELAHTPRVSVRNLVEEECLSVYELRDLKSLLSCLLGVTSALSLLRKAGFVHRDVSAGNSLYFEGRGILSDLEYAKEYEKISASGPQTGTPGFMAVECQAKEYLFHPWLPLDCGPGAHSKTDSAYPSFIPNPVHDLESVVWQHLWFLHHRVPRDLDSQKNSLALLTALDAVSSSGSRLFVHDIHASATRQNFVTTPPTSQNHQALLKNINFIHDRELFHPYRLLYMLCEEYRRIESSETEVVGNMRRFPLSVFQSSGIYDLFKDVFQKALDLIDKDGNVLVESSNAVRHRLTRRVNDTSDSAGQPTTSGSRLTNSRTSTTPGGKPRASGKKRSLADARLDNEEHDDVKRKKRSDEIGDQVIH